MPAASLVRGATLLRFSFRSPVSSSLLLPLRPPIPRIQRPPRISSSRRAPLVLISMLPIHSALASARLVSRLPVEPSACLEGKFANYLSPI